MIDTSPGSITPATKGRQPTRLKFTAWRTAAAASHNMIAAMTKRRVTASITGTAASTIFMAVGDDAQNVTARRRAR